MSQAKISSQPLEEEEAEVTQPGWPRAQWPLSPQWAVGQPGSTQMQPFKQKY